MITDSISNFLSKIKNGYLANKYKIIEFNSNKIINILNILIKEGFIKSYKISKKNNKYIYIYLKYKNNKPVLLDIKRISTPGKRIYIKNKDLFKIKNEFYILTTSYGLMTHLKAKQLNIGGEVICSIK